MKIIVTAGGTGGHIYPALGIINEFKKRENDLDILYIGTHNRMEKDIIPAEGIKYEAIEIYGLTKNVIRDIKNVYLIEKAYKKCLKIMKEFQPDLVIGVGGYVTYPVVKAAAKLGIKVFLHEQNSIPGKSNRMLEKYADLIGVSFSSSIKYFKNQSKVFVSGNPCGERALTLSPMRLESLGLDDRKKLVVIVSGSLGSLTINEKMKEYLGSVGSENYQVLYITGKNYYDEYSKYKFPKNVHIEPYIDNLSALLHNTDLLVSRAGASTISEIISLELPSILIPSPYVANNHQYFNALDLVNSGSALMIEEKDLTTEKLCLNIRYLLNDKINYDKMKTRIRGLNKLKSSELIYDKIKEILK